MIQVFKPTCGPAELSQVADCFQTGWLGKGRKVEQFEAAWAAHIGVDPAHVVSVNCATEGLFQICSLLLDPGDEVIIPSVHFIGADNAIRSAGAVPIYCDVDRRSLNPALECIVSAYNADTVMAVILLHYGGVAQELDDIRAWCDERDVWLIEDAACAQATAYQGKAAGTWGHFGVWSFDAMKVMTAGDGGMVYCENAAYAHRMRNRFYLGTNSPSGLLSERARWWEFTSLEPGRRAIMNDLAAGIGLEQLKQLPSFVERRMEIVRQYDAALCGLVTVPPSGTSPYYFYWIQTERRDELARYLRDNGIYVTFRYYPLHRVFETGQFLPGADYAAGHTLLLPLHQGLSDNDVQFVIDKVKEFY